ncbi:hypothetical protein [Flavobacterium sp. 25HG05S-40]|uniref:hypothetical protein n=1 Tax=Flavobacterium sp. 25HG05S-40 TaxID=3458682 RepID=UPI00404484CA
MESEPKVILIEGDDMSNCNGLADLRRLIREGKVVLITGAIIGELMHTATKEMEDFGKAMSSFSAELTMTKESMEALIESLKLSEYQPYDFFPVIPVQHNYKRPNLIYNYHRDKRKYRAPVNRR